MELQEFKTGWQKQATIGYSTEELDSIFSIKQQHSLATLRSGLTWDLAIALLIAGGFIMTLQILNLRTSNFWSVWMALFAIQHVVFYKLQVYWLKKNNTFINNVSYSINLTIGKIKVLLWIYRLWPATLTIILAITYITLFNPGSPMWVMLIVVLLAAIGVAAVSNMISAVLLRKHLLKLEKLAQELFNLSK